MDRQVRSKMNTQIYEEACAWFVECRSGDLDNFGRRDFDCWLRKSPEHVSSYIEIAAIWNEGPLLDPDGKWSADTLIKHARGAGDDNVVALTGGAIATASTVLSGESSRTEFVPASTAVHSQQVTTRKAWVIGWRWSAIAASVAVLMILAGGLVLLELSAPIYATALGEQRSIQFEDGSTVELNSRSRIRVNYSKQERGVELIEGQALFHVAHDTSRPFIVAVGATRVRAVGTQFDVYRKSNGTVVTVVEGRVAVYSAPQSPLAGNASKVPQLPSTYALPESSGSAADPSPFAAPRARRSFPTSATGSARPPAEETARQDLLTSGASLMVAAGEQVTVTADAAQKIANANIASATAWREREIVFESATLSDVAEEFNRYNQRQLVIKDPTLYGFHISGVFSSTDPDSLIRFLRQRPGVTVTEMNGEIRIERGP
jgi:transmembrane sensor